MPGSSRVSDALYTPGAPAVLAALDALVPPDAAAAKVVETTRAYCADNATRRDYPRFVAQQLPIGSGAVESLGKSLIEARLQHAGMRGTRTGAQAIATLRALSLSGAWEAFSFGPATPCGRGCGSARPPGRGGAPVPSPAVVPPAALRSGEAPAPAPPHHPHLRLSHPGLLPCAVRPQCTPGAVRRLDGPAVRETLTISWYTRLHASRRVARP